MHVSVTKCEFRCMLFERLNCWNTLYCCRIQISFSIISYRLLDHTYGVHIKNRQDSSLTNYPTGKLAATTCVASYSSHNYPLTNPDCPPWVARLLLVRNPSGSYKKGSSLVAAMESLCGCIVTGSYSWCCTRRTVLIKETTSIGHIAIMSSCMVK